MIKKMLVALAAFMALVGMSAAPAQASTVEAGPGIVWESVPDKAQARPIETVQQAALRAASDCPTQQFCLWAGYNYSGTMYHYTRANFTNAYHNGIRLGGLYMDNQSYSWVNKLGSSWSVNMYDDGTCHTSPWYRTMVNNQQATAGTSDWGGRVSSIQLQSASPLTC